MKTTMTKASKPKTVKMEASKRYRVLLSSVGNPDFGQYAPLSPSGAVDSDSFDDCREICRAYQRKFNLGGGNWSGGQVIENATGKVVARFSYNLRLWEGNKPWDANAKEILIEKKPSILRDLKVGQDFTFPEGTEDAGIRFTVLEQNGESALVVANVNMAIRPQMNYSGSEKIIAL